jgi:hypothetical protein
LKDHNNTSASTFSYLHRGTMNQFCQLSGVKSVVPSPTCVGKLPGVSGSDDAFKNKVDRLVNHFMNEVVRVIMIHLGQYGSMEIQ